MLTCKAPVLLRSTLSSKCYINCLQLAPMSQREPQAMLLQDARAPEYWRGTHVIMRFDMRRLLECT